jgi:hypothetical protein
MNNLAYTSQDAAYVGGKVEEKVRESQSGGLTLKIKRCCKVIPQEGRSMLLIGTLPRPTKMGFGAAIDAKDFFDIADMVEAAL